MGAPYIESAIAHNGADGEMASFLWIRTTKLTPAVSGPFGDPKSATGSLRSEGIKCQIRRCGFMAFTEDEHWREIGALCREYSDAKGRLLAFEEQRADLEADVARLAERIRKLVPNLL
jgi:hypothetical protein